MLSSGKLHFILLKSFCNSQYKYLIFSTFYGLYILHRDQRPTGFGGDQFTPFLGKVTEDLFQGLGLQLLWVEVANPFQLPHFTGNNSQHLCNALGQDQRRRSSRARWGEASQKVGACSPPGEGGGNWTQKPQKIVARQSEGPVCPDLPDCWQKLEIWIFFFNGKYTFFPSNVGIKWYYIL